MIDVLDESLSWLLRLRSEPGSLLREAEISFEMPNDDWRARITQLTLNCYLYDVRENKALRTREPLVARTPDGRTLVQPVSARVDCTYCITAWTPPNDQAAISSGGAVRYEHRLLSQALSVLLRSPLIEALSLQDPDGGSRLLPTRPTRLASAEEERGMSEFWSALGQQPKPSLNFVLTMAVPLEDETRRGAPVETIHVSGDLRSTPSPT